MENQRRSFRQTNLVLQLIYDRKLKVKLINWSLQKSKKRHFLYRLPCPKEVFFNICVLCQCIFSIHPFTFQKNITSYTFLLVFKIVETLQCVLSFETSFLKNENFFKKTGVLQQKVLSFLVERSAIERVDLSTKKICEKPMLRQIRMGSLKCTYHKERRYATNYFFFENLILYKNLL